MVGRFIRIGLFSGILFWLLWGFSMSRYWGLKAGLTAGAFAGLFFGLGMGGFSIWLHKSRTARMQVALELEKGEETRWEGPANHKMGAEYRGGWLRLTNRRLAFRAHAVNFRTFPVDLPLGKIAGAQPARTLGVVPNGLRVRTADGTIHAFVVEDRMRWAKEINSLVMPSATAS